MKITFDQAKNASNFEKHGVSLADAANIEWDTLWEAPDMRRDYGEVRIVGYALIKDRAFCVIFTDRDGERRIISLRKANNREKMNYADHL